MAWFKGTATDYKDFMNQLKNLVKDDHISAATIQDGGTGYAIGDTITLSGGTKYHEPEIEVMGISSGDYITVAAVNAGGTGYAVGDSLVPTTGTYSVAPELTVATESGGVVTGITIHNPGICSAQPTNPVATTSDGSGVNCTIDFTFTAGTGIITGIHIADSGVYTAQATNPVSQNTSSGSGTGFKTDVTYTDTAWATKIDIDSYELTATAISAAGTGYTLNDVVTVVGGTSMVAATVRITAESGGVPSAVVVLTSGDYSTTPGNPASTSGGTGSGLTLTNTWTLAAAETKYLMLHNTNTDQYIGWRAFYTTTPEDCYLLECTGFTGFNTISTPWDQQPGTSSPRKHYLPLSGGASPATIYYWISVSDDRITGVCKVGSVYPNFYLGAINPYLTANEWNYPQIIMGCASQEYPYDYAGADYAGMNNPGGFSSTYPPGFLRRPSGYLQPIMNWYLSAGNPLYWDAYVKISPSGGTDWNEPSGDNGWYTYTWLTWRECFKEQLSIPSSQDYVGRVNSEFCLLPCVLADQGAYRMYGELQGVFAFNPDGAVVAEDRILANGVPYKVFHNCGKTNRNYYFCIKEA
jgi:hypothetical protein